MSKYEVSEVASISRPVLSQPASTSMKPVGRCSYSEILVSNRRLGTLAASAILDVESIGTLDQFRHRMDCRKQII
jgi:hypothetical protein